MNRLKQALLGLALLLAAVPAFSAGMSDYLENKIADHLFRATSFAAPTTLCVGLVTGTSSDTSTGAAPGTEASYTGYTRTALNAGLANWTGTHGTTSGTSSGTNGTVSNASIITIGGAATSGPQVVTGFFIADSCTVGAGNIHFYAPLTVSKTINNGDPAPTFAIGALTVQMDN